LTGVTAVGKEQPYDESRERYSDGERAERRES
jgi:hypothetical protein